MMKHEEDGWFLWVREEEEREEGGRLGFGGGTHWCTPFSPIYTKRGRGPYSRYLQIPKGRLGTTPLVDL